MTNCLPSTGSNTFQIIIVGLALLVAGVAMVRSGRSRALLAGFALVGAGLCLSVSSTQPAQAACSTSTTVPSGTPTTFTGMIYGLPAATDDCTNFAESIFDGCDVGSVISPDVLSAWITTVTATNTTTNEVKTATLTPALTTGSACVASCGLAGSEGFTGVGSFSFSGLTTGTWTIALTFNNSILDNNPGGAPGNTLEFALHAASVNSSTVQFQATSKECAHDVATLSPVTLSSTSSTASFYLSTMARNYC